jgi:hypothetical protein
MQLAADESEIAANGLKPTVGQLELDGDCRSTSLLSRTCH